MSAIRVPRTRRENTVQQRGATLPGGDLDPGSGRTWTQNVLAGYAAVALALILVSRVASFPPPEVLALFAVGDVYVSLCKKKRLRSIYRAAKVVSAILAVI